MTQQIDHTAHQEDLNAMWKRRKKGKVPLKFLSKEESLKKGLERIGDRTRGKIINDFIFKNWKKRNGKGR